MLAPVAVRWVAARPVLMRSIWIVALGLVLAVLGLGRAQAGPPSVELPDLQQHVMDLTGSLPGPVQDALDAQLVEFEAERGSQLVVLILPTTGEESVQTYSLRAARTWQLGRKGVDDGILVVVARDDRQVFVQVGRGLHRALPGEVVQRIVDENLLPALQRGDLAGAVQSGVNRLLTRVRGARLPVHVRPPLQGTVLGLPFVLPVLALALSIGLAVLGATRRIGTAFACAGIVSFVLLMFGWQAGNLLQAVLVSGLVFVFFAIVSFAQTGLLPNDLFPPREYERTALGNSQDGGGGGSSGGSNYGGGGGGFDGGGGGGVF